MQTDQIRQDSRVSMFGVFFLPPACVICRKIMFSGMSVSLSGNVGGSKWTSLNRPIWLLLGRGEVSSCGRRVERYVTHASIGKRAVGLPLESPSCFLYVWVSSLTVCLDLFAQSGFSSIRLLPWLWEAEKKLREPEKKRSINQSQSMKTHRYWEQGFITLSPCGRCCGMFSHTSLVHSVLAPTELFHRNNDMHVSWYEWLFTTKLNRLLSVMQSTGWEEEKSCHKSPIHPQMVTRCLTVCAFGRAGADGLGFWLQIWSPQITPTFPQNWTFSWRFFATAHFAVYQKVTVSFTSYS